jgi:hypothetical protein
MPTAMVLVILPENIRLAPVVDATDLRMAAGAGPAMGATWEDAERFFGTG